MITRNALLAEQKQFFSEIQYNKGRYIDFLAKFSRTQKRRRLFWRQRRAKGFSLMEKN